MADPKHSSARPLSTLQPQPPTTTALSDPIRSSYITDRGRLSISHLSGEPSTQPALHHPTKPPSVPRLAPAPRTLPAVDNLATMHRPNMPPSMGHDITYTRTGRISKAKKGLKVHNCKCGRSYTRAEHLRRHQKNHEEDPLRCDFPDCGKAFHRPDLLQRHKERHSEMRRDIPRPESSLGLDPRSQSIPMTSAPASSMSSDFSSHMPSVMRNSLYPPVTSGPPASSMMDLTFGKARSFSISHPYVPSPVPIPSEGHIPLPENWCPSPPYSVSSGYASPGPGLLGIPLSMSTSGYSYPGTTAPSTSDPLSGFVMYPMQMKTHEERDEDEQKILFPQGTYDVMSDFYQSGDYLNSYWQFFHPAYSIVHRSTFQHEDPSPLLRAAVMAVGAQFSKQPNAQADSRNWHERCLKLLSQRDLDVSLPQRTCDMQAIFLVELLSQYKGRRASQQFSPRFRDMYQMLAQDNDVLTPAILHNFISMALNGDEQTKHAQWTHWTELATKQRLLVACHILESQQASFLARTTPTSIIQGQDVPIPARLPIWDADSASTWVYTIQQCPPTPNFVFEVETNNFAMPQPLKASDAFQSALLISTHCNPFKLVNSSGCAALTHTIDPSITTQILFISCQLHRCIPLRDLLAVSGESWILSEKVPSKETFETHKNNVRAWVAHLWQHAPSEYTPAPIVTAVKFAIRLLRLALTTSPSPTLIPGTEMGLYTSSLVLWAIASAATSRWKQCVRAATPTPQILPSSDPVSMKIEDLDRETCEFIHLFEMDEPLEGVRDVGRWPHGGVPMVLGQWQRGVGAVLRRVSSRIGGQGGSPGELIDGAVGVLGKLVRNGWGVELF